tara:strand:- start:33 stop:341 length:309 start_codon:yes stop_codon:yes gene_type:complete
MRKFTVELYANSEYSLSDRLKEIEWAITRTVWPSACFTENSRKHLESGYIEEEKKYLLTDYEYDKEDPTWRFGGNTICTGKWKMQIVSDEQFVKFQETKEDL